MMASESMPVRISVHLLGQLQLLSEEGMAEVGGTHSGREYFGNCLELVIDGPSASDFIA